MFKESHFEKQYGSWEEFVEKVEGYSRIFPQFFQKAKEFLKDEEVDFSYWEPYTFLKDKKDTDMGFLECLFTGWSAILAYVNKKKYEELPLEELVFLESIITHFAYEAQILAEEENQLVDSSKLCELKDIIFFFSKDGIRNRENYKKAQSDEAFEQAREEKRKTNEYFSQELKQKRENIYEPNVDLVLEAYCHIMEAVQESEKRAIRSLKSDDLAEEKLKNFEEHISLIKKFWTKGVVINNIRVPIKTIINFFNMFEHENYAIKISTKEREFLNHGITFNLLLILFHRFRISAGVKEKREFLLAMEKYFAINFEYFTDSEAADTERTDIQIIEDCFTIINEYYTDYVACEIEELYEEIQPQDVLFDDFERELDSCADKKWELLYPMQYELERNVALIMVSKGSDKENLLKRKQELESEYKQKTIIARLPFMREQIAGSLYAIFLLSQAIELMQKKEDNFDELDEISDNLLQIEIELKRAVYRYPSKLKKSYQAEGSLNIAEIEKKEVNAIEMEKLELELKHEMLQESFEATNKSKELLKVNMEQMIAALAECDLEKIMKDRSDIVANCDLLLEDEAYLNEISEKISDMVQKMVSDRVDFGECQKNVLLELGDAARFLSQRSLRILATAEYLYSMYVRNKEKMKGFDYSCISALYYQSLESAYNELIYGKYIRTIDEATEKILKRRKTISVRTRVNTKQEGYGYFPETDDRGNDLLGRYIKFDYKKGHLETFCLYDNFIKLLEKAKDNDPEVTEFTQFLKQEFGANFKKDKMVIFIEGMKRAKEHRNNASHGGKLISYEEAVKDKQTVLLYDSIIEGLDHGKSEYMDLIKKLLLFYV